MLIRFDRLAAPVALNGCEDLLPRMAPLMNGWPWQPLPATAPHEAPAITVEAVSGGWRIRSRWTTAPVVYDDLADIVCALFADLIMAYVAADARLLCLHAGAVRMNREEDRERGRSLIVFPAHSHAGKSTLSTALALAGGALYSDDVLPIDIADGPDGGQGVALGLAPRPRLPLPDGLPAPLRSAIAGRIAAANRDHAYVALPSGAQAPRGERSPIGAFIRLERGASAGGLSPAPRSELMKLLLWQNFGARPPAAQMVARFAALTASAACWRLSYREADEAVDLLRGLPAWPQEAAK